MAGLRISGVQATLAKLERIGKRTNKAALRIVRAGAKDIADRASDYAPVDQGDLENSIVVEEDRRGNDRIVFYVGVDPSKLGEGYWRYGFRYDIEMHEGVYNPGPLSQAKNARVGGSGVGPKYLERALDEIGPEIEEAVKEATRGIL